MIKLKEINWSNFWEVIALKPNDHQTKFIHPVSVFMAESYINLKEDNPDISLAIYLDEILIGFTKIVFIPKKEKTYNLTENSYMIDALIIDKSYQEKGYGEKALIKIIDYINDFPFGVAETISLVSYEKNKKAINLFQKFSFNKFKSKNKAKGMYLYIKRI